MKLKNNYSNYNDVGDWGKELAKLWTNYLPPCRPSVSELIIYSKYISELRNNSKRLKILILGSTSEFRDLAFEENLDVTIVDKSEGYHHQISWELRHKYTTEEFVNCKWQDMQFSEEFDVVVGDLVIGNIQPFELQTLLNKINNSLKDNGLFITKSFFANPNKKVKEINEIFKSYYKEYYPHHPYPSLIYDIAQNSLNWQNYILVFNTMYKKITKLYEDKNIDLQMMKIFKNLGWQDNMKFGFYMPTFQEWEENIAKLFSSFKKEYSADIYYKDFPIYVLTK